MDFAGETPEKLSRPKPDTIFDRLDREIHGFDAMLERQDRGNLEENAAPSTPKKKDGGAPDMGPGVLQH